MKTLVVSGKRKKAVARATIRKGDGRVTINGVSLSEWSPAMSRVKIREPLTLAPEVVAGVAIDVRVQGGGFSSQADAARLAIAKALVGYSKSERIKERFLKYDRHLLVADVRRKEPAKPNRHGSARAKRQKSYR